jgi:hypothetical protein
MQIEFTKEQFFTLMKTVYLGNWMANAQRTGAEDDPRKAEYEQLEDYVFSKAKEFGFGEYVDDEGVIGNRAYPTRLFEESTGVDELLEEYDGETFWDEIIDRLGERDLLRRYTPEALSQMSTDEKVEKLFIERDKWGEEFEKHGVERLEVLKP